jgi:chromosome segregation ATPase
MAYTWRVDINLNIKDLHIHYTGASESQIAAINQSLRHIMATQAEQAATLQGVLTTLQKVATEIDGLQANSDLLLQKITELEAVIAAGGEASAELTAAVEAVRAQAQVLDEDIPDLPPVPVV